LGGFLILFFLVLWFLGFLFFWKIHRVEESIGLSPNPLPVSIIIPARNEEKNLSHLLDSLKGQLASESEIIVVDDHSEDTTALVAGDFKVDVIASSELPQGWVGKTWACWQGALKAKQPILVFLDADTFFEPGGLSRLLAVFSEKGSFLSLQPFHLMKRPYEQLSAYFNIIAMAGSNAFTFLGSRIKPLGGFGPCMVCRKEDYFKIGGHQKVAAEIIENIILGKEFRKIGLEIRCLGGKGILNFRMYPQGFKSMANGFIKSFAVGSKAISLISLIGISAWITGGMAVTRLLIQSLFFPQVIDLTQWILIDLLFAAQLFWMLIRIGNFHWLTAFFFQIPLIFFIVVFFISLVKTFFLKQVTWKGRTFKPGQDQVNP
jgi:4,4'-diaponeurosporenoate glycosyltransferase